MTDPRKITVNPKKMASVYRRGLINRSNEASGMKGTTMTLAVTFTLETLMKAFAYGLTTGQALFGAALIAALVVWAVNRHREMNRLAEMASIVEGTDDAGEG